MNYFKYLGLASLLALTACSDDDYLAGNPLLTPKGEVSTACFGDSLPFTFQVEDGDVPLSTLKAQLYYGDIMVQDVVIRTKTSGTDYSGKIFIPYMANIPNGEATLKFILQNIHFTTTEKTYALPVSRPDYPSLTFVADDGTEYTMLRDEAYQYSLTQKLPQKQKGYIRLPKYGENGNELLVGWANNTPEVGAESPIPFSNSHAGKYAIRFNTYSFETSPFVTLKINGEELEAIDDNSASVDLSLTQGQTVELSGFPNVEDWWIDPDFFAQDEAGKITFRALGGKYRVIADSQYQYLRVQAMSGSNLATLQSDGSGAVWVIGEGVGKPSVSSNAVGWTTEKALCMAQLSAKKYQLTLVAGKTVKADGINFKFFHQAGWGGEFSSTTLTTTSDLIFVGDGSNGRDSGNLGLLTGRTFDENGIYVFTLDLSAGSGAGVLSVQKTGTQSFQEKKVFLGGTKMTTTDNSNYTLTAAFTQQQELNLGGISDLSDWWADPNYFTLDADKGFLQFLPVNGTYKIKLNRDQKVIQAVRMEGSAEATMNADGHGGLWLMGWGVGSPSLDSQCGWTPGAAYCVPEVSPGIYQFTGVAGPESGSGIGMRLRYDYLSFKFFFQDGWGGEFSGANALTLTDDAAKLLKNTGNFELADDVKLDLGSTYEITIDLTKGVTQGSLSMVKK